MTRLSIIVFVLLALLLQLSYAADYCQEDASTIDSIRRNFKKVSLAVECHQTNKFQAMPTAYHDGPNCFNAALVGKGYLSELTYTEDVEISFFLDKFCHEVAPPERSGDILIVARKEGLAHAAVALSDGNIFEKLSTWGKSPALIPEQSDGRSPEAKAQETRERSEASQYLVKQKSSSPYFNSPEAKIKIYRCKDADEVSVKLKSLNQTREIQALQKINKKIEDIVFKEKLSPTYQEDLAPSIAKFADMVSKTKLNGENAQFLQVKTASLLGQLFHLNPSGLASESKKYSDAKEKLQAAKKVLDQKIKNNTN